MTKISEQITSSVALDVKVREWLRKNGYRVDSDNRISFRREHSFLFIRWPGFQSAANLSFESPSNRWLMKVYGRAYKAAAEVCATRLAIEFNVKIHVVLETEYVTDPNGGYWL